MYFSLCGTAIRKLHRGDTFFLAPLTESVALSQHRHFADAVSFSNHFDSVNETNNLKIH
jgi:hypothetical protein